MYVKTYRAFFLNHLSPAKKLKLKHKTTNLHFNYNYFIMLNLYYFRLIYIIFLLCQKTK